MRSETRYLSQKQTHSRLSESKERVSNITTDSQNFRLSDFSEDGKQVENFSQLERSFEYKKFFEQKLQQEEISPALHKKAINWLVTFCWTRNYSEEVLWYSIGYFYSYSYSRVIKKDRLTLTLISAINLANKLFQPEGVMGFEMMKSLLNNVWSTDDFRTVEGELLEIFDFDLYFPTVLGDIMEMGRPEEQKAKILFLAQSLFMNSYEPAINDIILEDIMFLISEPQSEYQLRTEMRKLFKSPKYMDIMKQKYASKFNIDEFLQKLLKEK